MKLSNLCACALVAVAAILPTSMLTNSAAAQGLASTTEYGVTIGPEEIMAGIQETQDFWGPVRTFVVSENFPVAELQVRQEAVAFLRGVHDDLQARLFEGDEKSGIDLVNFLAWRLRKFEIYRQIRTTINNDQALAELMIRWEKTHRDINTLQVADRAKRVEELVKHWPNEMKALGVATAALEPATALWTNLAGCMQSMSATETGKMMIEAEANGKRLERTVAELVLQIATAADWALVTKGTDGSITRTDFERSWKQLSEYSNQRLAVKPVEVK